MLTDFIAKKLDQANYKLLEDGTYFGEISGLKGVWSSGLTLEDCRRELQEVLEDWLLFKVRDHEKIPGFSLRANRPPLLRHA